MVNLSDLSKEELKVLLQAAHKKLKHTEAVNKKEVAEATVAVQKAVELFQAGFIGYQLLLRPL